MTRRNHPVRSTACRRIVLTAVFVLTGWSIVTTSVSAQALRSEITAAHPAPDVAVAAGGWLTSDRPRVAIHRPDAIEFEASEKTRDIAGSRGATGSARATRIRDAVTDWELLLLGLGIPYAVIGDKELERGPHRDIDVLVMPAATYAGESQIRSAARFVRGGGGLVAAGVPALDPLAASALGELVGARFEAAPLPDGTSSGGLYQVVHRTPALPTGAPAGFRLNVAVRDDFRPARPAAAQALGPIIPYESGDAFDGLTGMLVSTAGEGRIVWTAFLPQDVSDEPEQQLVWQRLAFGALARTGGMPSVSIEAWPDGRRAGFGVAVMPSPGNDPVSMVQNADYLVAFLEREAVPATFFLPGGELAPFPHLTERMAAVGEFGVTTRSGRGLHGQSADVQAVRLREGAEDLMAATGGQSATTAPGFLPPGFLFDGSTLQAVREGGFDYILRAGGPSLAPDSIAVHEHVDFRDADDPDFVATLPVGAPVVGSSSGASPGTGSADDYASVVRAGGLYVLPYRVEEIPPGSVRFESFTELITRARMDETAIMSLSDISEWITRRRAVRVGIVRSGEGGATLNVRNSGPEPVSGIVLRWEPGHATRLASIGVSDARVTVEADHASGTAVLAIPELPAGSTLELQISNH